MALGFELRQWRAFDESENLGRDLAQSNGHQRRIKVMVASQILPHKGITSSRPLTQTFNLGLGKEVHRLYARWPRYFQLSFEGGVSHLLGPKWKEISQDFISLKNIYIYKKRRKFSNSALISVSDVIIRYNSCFLLILLASVMFVYSKKRFFQVFFIFNNIPTEAFSWLSPLRC